MTIDLNKANIFSIILFFIISILAFGVWCFLWGKDHSVAELGQKDKILGAVICSFAFLPGIALHELIHGIVWASFAKSGWKSISFGVIWKVLCPYCHCDEPLKLRPYIIGALMPLFVLGVLPLIYGICADMLLVVVFGIVFTASASGDILVVWKLRNESRSVMVLDHPSEAGCIIFDEDE